MRRRLADRAIFEAQRALHYSLCLIGPMMLACLGWLWIYRHTSLLAAWAHVRHATFMVPPVERLTTAAVVLAALAVLLIAAGALRQPRYAVALAGVSMSPSPRLDRTEPMNEPTASTPSAHLAYVQALCDAYQEAWWAARSLLEQPSTEDERADGVAAIKATITAAGAAARAALRESVAGQGPDGVAVLVDLEAMFGPRRSVEPTNRWRRLLASVRRRPSA